MAARHASSDRLFLCDAEILIGSEALRRAIDVIDSGQAWLPIFLCLDPQGNEDYWQDEGYGLVGVKKGILEAVGWVPEFQSWGGEDNLLRDALAKRVKIVRERRTDLRHQWHPDELRDINYARPRFSDYDRRISAPVRHGGEPSHRIWGNHSHWTRRGLAVSRWPFFERPGVDAGNYVLAESRTHCSKLGSLAVGRVAVGR